MIFAGKRVGSGDDVAVITGANSGIGKAIALALASQGMTLCLVGRTAATLKSVSEQAMAYAHKVFTYQVDLTNDNQIRDLKENLQANVSRVDILVHSAGAFSLGNIETAAIEDLDRQYRINVRAPYLLTQTLLPMLKTSQGQIVFINSSVGLAARPGVGQYAATKHALKAIADSLRAEVNTYGLRILSIYPGRTASPMQLYVHDREAKDYKPNRLIQPEDIAAVVLNSLNLPRTAEVTDIEIRPFLKPV